MCFFSVKIAYYTRRRGKFTEKQLCQHLIPRNFSVRQIKITGEKQSFRFFLRKPSKIVDPLRSRSCLLPGMVDTLLAFFLFFIILPECPADERISELQHLRPVDRSDRNVMYVSIQQVSSGSSDVRSAGTLR